MLVSVTSYYLDVSVITTSVNDVNKARTELYVAVNEGKAVKYPISNPFKVDTINI
jgi:hypothetical protein